MRKTLAVLTALMFVCGSAIAAGDPDAGKAKAATCLACHGPNGNSVNPEWPSLAGQHEQYTAMQLATFKNGQRENVLMAPMALPLSEDDMADLGAYYATQTMTPKEADPDKVRLGQAIYRGGNVEEKAAACIACHGPNGRGNAPAAYPSIQGQHANYTAAQLRAYRSGERRTDASQMMRNVAAELSDAEIDAVASYVQGLQ